MKIWPFRRNCERDGHDEQKAEREVYLYPSEDGSADMIWQRRRVCGGFFSLGVAVGR